MLYKNSSRIDEICFQSINHLGNGVFETFLFKKVSPEKVVVLALESHLQRLKQGCSILNLNYPSQAEIQRTLENAVNSFNWSENEHSRARIIVLEKDWFISIEAYERSNKSLSFKTYPMTRVFPEVKSCSAIVSVVSAREAQKQGFDEALLCDESYIYEGSWSNIFCVDKQSRIITPKLNILNGVTREIVFELCHGKFEIVERQVELSELHDMRECFTTRSTTGIQPISVVDEVQFKNFSLTNMLSEEYEKLYATENSFATIISI